MALRRFYLIFYQFQPDVAYKSIACKKHVVPQEIFWIPWKLLIINLKVLQKSKNTQLF